jgi:hypothetical protein
VEYSDKEHTDKTQLLEKGSKKKLENIQTKVLNLGFVVPCIFDHSNKTPN